ncbi:MAG: hypothetical protein WCD07_08215 [Burkholderiales bacterium]
MHKDLLRENFGQTLISDVRDAAIERHEKIVAGVMKSTQCMHLNEQLSSFSRDQQLIIRQAVVSAIDNVVHNFL